jgi:hypothetical protein
MSVRIIIVTIAVLALIVLVVFWARRSLLDSSGQVVEKCMQKADEQRIITARRDQDEVAEEVFFLCLSDNNLNPTKYTLRGKPPSSRIIEFIKKINDFRKK